MRRRFPLGGAVESALGKAVDLLLSPTGEGGGLGLSRVKSHACPAKSPCMAGGTVGAEFISIVDALLEQRGVNGLPWEAV